MAKLSINSGVAYAIASAVLFGINTPFAKRLLEVVNPWLLAGLFYLGSGLGIFVILLFRFIREKERRSEKFAKKDRMLLLLVTLLGGILAPLFLMYGLTQISAANASLLLNLEMVFTALFAWILFKEHTSFRLISGMILIVIGSILLTWTNNFTLSNLFGTSFIAAACLLWAFDNNITRIISGANSLKIAGIKSLAAGFTNTFIAFLIGSNWPVQPAILLFSMLIGFICYGMSLVCFILALRHIGTARTSAYFSTAPFIGALLALLMFGGPVSMQLLSAAILMMIGVWLHLTESHSHEHVHERLVHSHAHIHDEHHQHSHSPDDPKGEPHTHLHEHEPLKHTHPHFPDLHHRHDHKK